MGKGNKFSPLFLTNRIKKQPFDRSALSHNFINDFLKVFDHLRWGFCSEQALKNSAVPPIIFISPF